MVDKPLMFTMGDILRMPRTSRVYFLECAANSGMEWRGAQLNGCQFTHFLNNCSISGCAALGLIDKRNVETTNLRCWSSGAGSGATGFYQDRDKRYRVLSIFRGDLDQAKDVLKTFGKVRGASEEKGVAEGAYRVVLSEKDGSKIEWVIGRSAWFVMGVGDEEFAVQPGMTPAEHDRICLSREEKITRLKALLK